MASHVHIQITLVCHMLSIISATYECIKPSNHIYILLNCVYVFTGGKRYQHNQAVAADIHYEWQEIQ
jgi:hypothetical protein